MKILLDTHAIIWALTDDKKLTASARKDILDTENIVCFSVASIWEIAIKNFKAPKACPYNEKMIYDKCIASGFEPLDINSKHIFAVRELRIKEKKKLANLDPFDRILIAQAKTENMKLYSADANFDNYEDACIHKL